jgi:hypothetical protein
MKTIRPKSGPGLAGGITLVGLITASLLVQPAASATAAAAPPGYAPAAVAERPSTPAPPPPRVAPPRAPAARSSPGVAEVMRMVEAKVDPGVIRAYIANSQVPYHLSADEIIALRNGGLSGDIIAAMIQRGGELRAQAGLASGQVAPYPPPAAYPYDYGEYPPAAPAYPEYPDYGYDYPYDYYGYPADYWGYNNGWYPWDWWYPWGWAGLGGWGGLGYWPYHSGYWHHHYYPRAGVGRYGVRGGIGVRAPLVSRGVAPGRSALGSRAGSVPRFGGFAGHVGGGGVHVGGGAARMGGGGGHVGGGGHGGGGHR